MYNTNDPHIVTVPAAELEAGTMSPVYWSDEADMWYQHGGYFTVVATTGDITVATTDDGTLFTFSATQPVRAYDLWGACKRYGFWVNVYSIDRCYGGPEEGGWWFNAGQPVATERCSTHAQAVEWIAALETDYPTTDARYSVLGGEDYSIAIEAHPGRPFPEERPHYE